MSTRLRVRRPNGPVWLVLVREVRTLVRSKAFLIGNAFMLLVLIGGGAVAALGDDDPFRLAALGDDAAELAERAASPEAVGAGADLRVVDVLDDRAAAEDALASDRVDGVLVSPDELLVQGSVPLLVEQSLNLARHISAVDTALADAGLGPIERETVLQSQPLQVTSLEDAPTLPPRQMLVALGATSILYLLLLVYGNRVAQSIVEEKASRVIEVVLAAIRPTQLLGGKVLGIGGVSLVQALVFAILIGGGVLVATDVAPTPTDLELIGWVVAWYVPGYALYAMLFAVVGALIPREQDMQSAAVPVMVPILAGLFAVQLTTFNPQSTLSTVAGLVPLTAPMVQPVRMGVGIGPAWEPIVAAGLTLATVAVLVPVAARLYAGGVLNTRTKVSLRRAWTSAERRQPVET